MTMTDENGTAATAEVSAAKSAARHPVTERTAAGVPASPATIDPEVWPGVAHAPSGTKALVAGKAAGLLFKAAVRRLPLRVAYPDGSVLGTGGLDAPVMTMLRPAAFEVRIGDNGLIGLGESFMAGDWEASDLAGVLEVFAASVDTLIPAPLQKLRTLYLPRTPRQERNEEHNTRSNISRHYDLSNELFSHFLDTTMSYSSALFPLSDGALDAVPWDALAEAQQTKIDRLLDKAGVGSGTRLLEIGTGWGELALRAAARGATVYSVTLSSEQRALAQERIAAAGYADQVTVALQDYRAVEGEFDAVVSVEMIEAVGYEYWPIYFQTIDRVLAPGGKVAIQAITMPHGRMLATRNAYTWVHKYIFPGGFLPSVRAIESVTQQHTTLRVRERMGLGDHYAATLRLWEGRFMDRSLEVGGLGFDAVFQRMWLFYLCYSRAGFQSGYLDVQQIVLDRREAQL
ncbi:class I SAM-dependent methyltransferase [Pseudarthrobacter sp. MDT3-26]|uniref:class I SAM-dependent methyltransferase n=1 Tax=Pseudarthrobacter raffinosi TaxID=2953651 RepID=UPI00208EFDE8|nr:MULTISPECIES: class I SAM-dependent methyltransferase [unclassified Pseudarthrobacter]MCO4237166.1 class I SAM-dependent methyltransferase [Pseudarthrobacter sp. MDT3-28]MCO4261928.1 class I SAM-dependent methyltransferase [Pseudarthrobacter sp. MDT3-26]